MAKNLGSVFSRIFLFTWLSTLKARVKVRFIVAYLLYLALPMSLVQSTLLVSASAPAPNALAVYGQPDLHSNANNNGGLSSTSLYNPQGLAANDNGVYIADAFNNRILHFPLNINLADTVLGQTDFSQNSANQGGSASASTLNYPVGVALDSSGGLFVADEGNNRVLYFPQGATAATRVYGQGAGCNNFSGTAAAAGTTGLHGPFGVTVDGSGGIYVSDTGNNRVVYFPATGCTASRVYGQGASGTSFNTTNFGSTATTLNLPYATAVDGSGDLYVADNANNRVVYYPAGSFTATGAYGQPDLISHGFGISPTTLHDPAGVVLDANGGLYVTDFANNRVVYYHPGAITASRVYGQPSYISSTANYGGLGPASLQAPFGLAITGDGTILASDSYNNRVVSFAQIGEYTNSIAAAVYGQPNFTTRPSSQPGPTSSNMYLQHHIALDAAGGLYVADTTNNRVLYFPADSATATRVYGQGPSGTNFTSSTSGFDATHLNVPFGVAVDNAGGLYVADSYNNRVVYFPAGSFTATKVYGQPNLNSNDFQPVQSTSLNYPVNVTVDQTGGLYVADRLNNRVLYYPPTAAPAANIAATRVYGQGPTGTNFTSNASQTNQTSLIEPSGVALDEANGVYISDTMNNRVLYYPAGSITPTRLYGQADYSGHVYGTSATSFAAPYDLTIDSQEGLYVADFDNNRVVFFPAGSTEATRLYGQPDFSSNAVNYGGAVTASNFGYPSGVVLDRNQNLYISDSSNGRILRYNYLPDCNPLTVTNPMDNGSYCTLRAALMQAHSGDTITLGFGAGTATIHLQSSLGTLPSNLTIQGTCSGTGPAITLDGTGVKDNGIELSGGDHLIGLKIKGFEGNQLKMTTTKGAGPNTLSCVVVSRN